MNLGRFRLTMLLGGLLFVAGSGAAGEKKFLHCSFFEPLPQAFDADWEAFHKATDELPGKIPGLSKVWAGKLQKPYNSSQYGVCMEMENADTLRIYAEHPAHLEWVNVYSRVLKTASTQLAIIGQ